MTKSPTTEKNRFVLRGKNATAAICFAVFVGMVGMAYAAVPLYKIFCSVTGYGGTTRVAEAAPDVVLDRIMEVRFDANVAGHMAWTFKPVKTTMKVKVGESAIAYYEATNNSDHPITGTASFNVSPDKAGVYFNKIECFCFTEQTLAPGETVEMPVTFFVDPDLVEDYHLDNVQTITLSYTFFETAES